MPIIWRFLLSQYLKVLVLCVTAFIAILLTTRLDDVAHIAALGAESWHILLFALYQIPYILPIAIPISCLISTILLVQRLSKTHELTAFRACGISLRNFLTPLLFAGAVMALVNFTLISELATNSHLSSGLMREQLRGINPLFMLQNKHLIKMKGMHIDILGPSQKGESASQVVLALPNKANNRINLMVAETLKATPEHFKGEGVTFISAMPAEEEGFDQLIVENIAKADTTVEDFSQMLQRKAWSVNNDHLRMSLLLAKLSEESSKKEINRIYSEMFRRLSLGFAAFTFTLMGASFGVCISRNRSNRGIFMVIILAAIYMCAYFIANGIDHLLIASSLVYTLPHLMIILFSLWMLSRVSRGIE